MHFGRKMIFKILMDQFWHKKNFLKVLWINLDVKLAIENLSDEFWPEIYLGLSKFHQLFFSNLRCINFNFINQF